MPQYYDQLTQLLHEPEEGTVFQQFLQSSEGAYSHTVIRYDCSTYFFPELGTTITTLNGIVFHITMWINDQTVRSKNCKQYSGGLPFEIQYHDNADEVNRKIGRPFRQTAVGPDYDLSPFHLAFSFDGETGQIKIAWLGKNDFPVPVKIER